MDVDVDVDWIFIWIWWDCRLAAYPSMCVWFDWVGPAMVVFPVVQSILVFCSLSLLVLSPFT